MALSKTITEVHIRNKGFSSSSGDWIYTFKTQDLSSGIGQVNYGSSFDEAVNATLRSNIRGFRVSISLSFNKIHNASVSRTFYGTGNAETFGGFFTSVIDSMVEDGDEYIEMSLNGTDYMNVIPSDLSQIVQYTRTIGRASAEIKFSERTMRTSIPSFLEAPSI